MKPHHIPVSILLSLFILVNPMSSQTAGLPWMKSSLGALQTELIKKYGETQRERIERGLRQVAAFWRNGDGDENTFKDFAITHFVGDQAKTDEMFNRYEYLLEKLNGHLGEVGREFRSRVDIDEGSLEPFDEIFAGYDVAAHVTDDFFQNKLAFIVLLNFPLTTLEQRLNDGERWTRRQWAEARLAQIFSKRIPADVNLEIARVTSDADRYISDYNIWMHHLLDGDGNRLFPPKLRLLSHWNLRDELKANYENKASGLPKQEMIQRVMERIVTQTIPEVVVNNPRVDWNPYSNDVKLSPVNDAEMAAVQDLTVTNSPEPDTRYSILLGTFKASQMLDLYSPTAPTLIARRFDENREIPEGKVREMFEQVLTSPYVKDIAKIIEKQLGRPLKPFDIWYNGLRQRGGSYSEKQLNEIVSKKYPNAKAFKDDIPAILQKLGFSKDRAEYIAGYIVVDPARGSGHAAGASMKGAQAHLRTRIEKSGMNYKGYNIAIHELGHNVEQVLSLNDIDYWTLQGVPNTAFTEALAYLFQNRDMSVLGLPAPSSENEAMNVLHDFWTMFEIAGVSMIDMDVWHWMYDNPNATPHELKSAVIKISKELWNKYFSEVFGVRDVLLLGIYSHMVDSFMYLPDYAIGHLIAFQIEKQIEKSVVVGPEFERMATAGRIAPDLWMKNATGSFVSAEPLLSATKEALKNLR